MFCISVVIVNKSYEKTQQQQCVVPSLDTFLRPLWLSAPSPVVFRRLNNSLKQQDMVVFLDNVTPTVVKSTFVGGLFSAVD